MIDFKLRFLTIAGICLAVSTVMGCKNESVDSQPVTKMARPVEVTRLAKVAPPASSLVSASVASWQTEELGMEVSGRIERVVEPNTDIEGRVVGNDGTVLIEGTPIARIDDERYRLQVENAKAQVDRAKQNIEGAVTELEKSIPAQIRAAEAEKKLALTEFERSKRLFEKNAGAQADVDRDEAGYEGAVSAIEQLESKQKAKESDLQSLRLQLLQNQKSLRDAQRSVEDCTLYSSFRGQISEVTVVQGSVISAGQAIATIQMMDPIKVELEVSSEDSRRLRNRQRLPILVTKEDGTFEEQDGFLYLVDPVADPQTRTFTLTLLVLNRRIESGLVDSDNIATSDQMWRLDIPFIPGADKDKTYINEQAILNDDIGPYLWRVENVGMHESLPKDQKIKVSKLRIALGAGRLPFLGNWLFQEIEVLDDTFDKTKHLVTGRINVSNGKPNEWDGDTILIHNSGSWFLRPGDLVKVDLSRGGAEAGYFVPMDAISYSDGKTYLFVLNDLADADDVRTVRQTEVILKPSENGSSISSLLRVEFPDDLFEGKQFVARGAHYLRDGESVRIVPSGDQR